MKIRDMRVFLSLFLFLSIAISAWPAYVACSIALSHLTEMLSVLDFIDAKPKRLLLREFLEGWRQSAPVACALGVLAVIDLQLLIRNRYTRYLAGITLPLALIALTLVFFKNYGFELAPTFAATGVVLWIIYRTLELLSRIDLG